MQEALDTAAVENSTVGYIQLVSDCTVVDTVYLSTGSLTIDLNGYSITDSDSIITYGANLTVTDTATGGKLIDKIYIISGKVTLLGGAFEKNEDFEYDVLWEGGVLDLSNYPNAAGVYIYNFSGNDVALSEGNFILPDNYTFYDEEGKKVDQLFTRSVTYTVDDIEVLYGVFGCFELQSGSKLTLSGALADIDVSYKGGAQVPWKGLTKKFYEKNNLTQKLRRRASARRFFA